MSDQTRTPSDFVKRAPTTSTAVAVSTSTSTVALIAYYINECLTAKHIVVPSTEMIIVLLGYAYPIGKVIGEVVRARLNKWAESEGVTQGN